MPMAHNMSCVDFLKAKHTRGTGTPKPVQIGPMLGPHGLERSVYHNRLIMASFCLMSPTLNFFKFTTDFSSALRTKHELPMICKEKIKAIALFASTLTLFGRIPINPQTFDPTCFL